jgi:hypothetical protein
MKHNDMAIDISDITRAILFVEAGSPVKNMKTIVSILVFAISTFAQVSLLEGPKVNGLGLSATYKEVVAKFGKPTTDRIYKVNECIGDRTRTLRYPGLMIEMDEQSGTFHVFSFEITSPKYDVSGVKIGDTPATVQRRFGTKKRTVENPGPLWYYEMPDENPGSTNFHFRRGKLVKIQATYMMC